MKNKNKYITKIVELDNKSRKGSYVRIYDTKLKKVKYYVYDPSVSIDNYIGYIHENKIHRKAIKTRIKETKKKYRILKQIAKVERNNRIESSEKVGDFVKRYKKKFVKIEFENKKNKGFDVNKKIREVYSGHGLKGKELTKAIKTHDKLCIYDNITLEFYGNNYEDRSYNVKLGFAQYTNVSLEKLKGILAKSQLEGRLIDNYIETLIDLKLDLGTNKVYILRKHARINRVKIIYESGR